MCEIYHAKISPGVISIDLASEGPRVWFERGEEKVNLYPDVAPPSPQLSLPFPEFIDVDKVQREYAALIPEMLGLLEDFPSEKYCLAAFCLRHGSSGVSLLKDTPALAYLIAVKEYFAYGRQELLTKISLEQKRTEILENLEMPGKKYVVKLLKKIPAKSCESDFFSDFKSLLKRQDSKVTKALWHTTRINHLLVQILSIPKLLPFIDKSLLEQTAKIEKTDATSKLFAQVIEIRDVIDDALEQNVKVGQLRRVEDLVDFHHKLIAWLADRRFLQRIKNMYFASPPLPSFENVEKKILVRPLKSGQDLWFEGNTMRHCLAGYASRILAAKGDLYAYHLEYGDEPPVTMMISKNRGHWEIEEIQGLSNTLPTDKMLSFALSLLESA